MMPPREGPPRERRGSRLSRRGFVVGVAGLGLLAGCGRLPWQGQPPAKVPRVGYLMSSVPASSPQVAAFSEGLAELGYVEGQNIIVEYRFAEGREDHLPELAAELVRSPVDAILREGRQRPWQPIGRQIRFQSCRRSVRI
jgi:hypothetical protein